MAGFGQIFIDASDLGAGIERLNTVVPGIRSAVRTSIIETLTFAQSEIRRQINKRYDIEDPRNNFKTEAVKPAPVGKSSTSDITGAVLISTARMPTMRFNIIPRSVPNQKGIPVSERQQITRTVVKGSSQIGSANRFIAQMKSGHIGVFMRKPDATHRRRPDGQNTQLNISEEYMISPHEMTQSKEIRPQLEANLRDYFQRRLSANLGKVKTK